MQQQEQLTPAPQRPRSQHQTQSNKPSTDSGSQLAWQQKVQHLSQEIANDSKLKKKHSAKYYKHMDQANKLWDDRSSQPTHQEYLLLAGLYKNLGKLGEQQEILQKALVLLKKGGGGPSGTFIRWTLQLTALKSSSQKHKECFELAVKAIDQAKNYLKTFIVSQGNRKDDQSFAEFILLQAQEDTKDEVVWRYNDQSLQRHLLTQLRRTCQESLALPYFPEAEFHISDIMALESCKIGWQKRQINPLQQVIAYLSIGFFTMATQKYYTEDYSYKHCHIKALKIALASFDVNCAYVGFLIKILQQHFGKRLQAITEEESIKGQHNELARYMPKEIKQVSLKSLPFADQ